VISRCIEFDSVRWNAQIIRSDFVRALIPHVDPVPVCPEVEIGLGVPRETLRLVMVEGEARLMQPATGMDMTERMRGFAERFLGSLGEVDGFILKSKSPSSGLRGAKVYNSMKNETSIGRGPGIFGGMVRQRYHHLALEDEGRLNNSRIREHFLRKLYTLAGFRRVKASSDVNELIRFQTENKLQLMTYNQAESRLLGRIVANHGRRGLQDLLAEYEAHLHRALGRAPRCTSYVNTLMHSMGYFKDRLSAEEKAFFLGLLRRYREGKAPLVAPVDVMKAWIVRFKEDYLAGQTFFEPYSDDLIDVTSILEACGGRDYWKEE
jgi:uncharacterized protein YbgA (DUF1722 family)/uncharacterized protein YbbK (DUF523 family)